MLAFFKISHAVDAGTRTPPRPASFPVDPAVAPAGVLAGQVITRGEHGGGVLAAAAWPGTRRGVTGVIAGAGFRVPPRWGCPKGMISYRNDDGAWLNAAGDHAPVVATPARSPGWMLR